MSGLNLHKNVKTIALFSKQNYTLKLFTALKWPFLAVSAISSKKSFITSTTDDHFSNNIFWDIFCRALRVMILVTSFWIVAIDWIP